MKNGKKNKISILLALVFILAQVAFPLVHSYEHKKTVISEHHQQTKNPAGVKDDCGLCDILAHQHFANYEGSQFSAAIPVTFVKYFASTSNPIAKDGVTFLSRGPPALL